ncbi:MBL fold metallo-hydrolase [Sulfurovum sp.]|jgi:glyoxylase-like metal-dependent hydrolase (beta-lactamase superfamily II)|uniref:MBL fold metallo-hydrolase n=1 Tax=Sulfurovum sp. TaxID=1969726 RepID=UPI002A36AAF6|nr:MBL fold metallo-hydrolase [Sulfurovum sp.]MDD2451344.1 MBL fold metallo-hydrolase [Sulfurovum sp.]MDD3499841.1 MBL fold metallo-hydrolase [Sulfurovum sp.]MDY0403143.1 MBL fold metallo-hydrolase [Sulfurovum sp.]
MRGFGLFVLTLVSLEAFDYQLTPQKVTEDIYCFFGKPEMITKENGGNMVNSCFVKTEESYVVVDSGPTHAYAKQAYEAMQKVASLPVKYVITTHVHDDHWLGNSFYKEQGALLIGPREYEQSIAGKAYSMKPEETRISQIVSKDAFHGTEIVALDQVVEQTLFKFKEGGIDFEVKQLVPKAHTESDLVVFLPQKKALFTGDLVFNDRLTSMRDGSIIGNLTAIEIMEAMDAETIITGHGTRTDSHTMDHHKAYQSQMKGEVLEAIDEGVGMEKITKAVPMEKYKNEAMYEALHKRNVLDAYAELEMYEEEEE